MEVLLVLGNHHALLAGFLVGFVGHGDAGDHVAELDASGLFS